MDSRPPALLLLSGVVVFHALGHPFDHPHIHTPVAGEDALLLGKVGVVSSSTGRRAYADNLEPGRYELIGSPLSSSTSQSSNSAHN